MSYYIPMFTWQKGENRSTVTCARLGGFEGYTAPSRMNSSVILTMIQAFTDSDIKARALALALANSKGVNSAEVRIGQWASSTAAIPRNKPSLLRRYTRECCGRRIYYVDARWDVVTKGETRVLIYHADKPPAEDEGFVDGFSVVIREHTSLPVPGDKRFVQWLMEASKINLHETLSFSPIHIITNEWVGREDIHGGGVQIHKFDSASGLEPVYVTSIREDILRDALTYWAQKEM